MLVRYRRPKRSIVLPVVAVLAVAAPLAGTTLRDSTDGHAPGIRPVDDSNMAAIPTEMAEVALSSLPDMVLPLHEIAGLNLPDLKLSDLRNLPLPQSVPVPPGLPNPLGIPLPTAIPLPQLHKQQPTSAAPAPPDPGGPVAPQVPAAARPDAGPKFIDAPLPPPAPDPARIPGNPAMPALAPGAVPPDMAGRVGAAVKELTRDTPFSMVALTAKSLAGTTALIRAKQADGNWGPWYTTDPVGSNRNDFTGAPAKAGTEPIYVGPTKDVQVLTTHKAGAGDRSDAQGGDPVSAELINPGQGAHDDDLTSVAAALPDGGPKVISRQQWGADESIRCQEPTYDDSLGGIAVHHTDGRNDYSKAESAGIVRAIFAYHAKTLGWCDIGYNALVDKYGQIFEGRYGGLNRPVEGAHAGGFNENTAGVALLGSFDTQPPTEEQIQAVGRYIGWRAKTAGLDPKGHTTMYSEGTDYTKYPKGQSVDLPVVFAHRDVGETDCPGAAVYAKMDEIRDIAAKAAAGDPAPNQDAPKPAAPGPNVQALASLTSQLLGEVDKNVIAKYWASQGGPKGHLGDVLAAPMPDKDGGQFAKFANGNVYASATGSIVELGGLLLDRFTQLGGDSGALGAPLTSPYPVPGGQRADFQFGSLVLDTVKGVVTTIMRHSDRAGAPAADNIPAPMTAPGAPAGNPVNPPPATDPAPPAPASAPQPPAPQP
ncbi:MAG: LGFP repeat-containing protein, partial [Nocardia sp.]|nr:LGFP repeat-containing protein [Nocardia sp.]